jgi:hypothetical protein
MTWLEIGYGRQGYARLGFLHAVWDAAPGPLGGRGWFWIQFSIGRASVVFEWSGTVDS